jgi:hypothetical protein
MPEVPGARAADRPARGLSDGRALKKAGGRPIDYGMFHFSGPYGLVFGITAS